MLWKLTMRDLLGASCLLSPSHKCQFELHDGEEVRVFLNFTCIILALKSLIPSYFLYVLRQLFSSVTVHVTLLVFILRSKTLCTFQCCAYYSFHVTEEEHLWLNISKGTSCRKTSILSYGDAKSKDLKI